MAAVTETFTELFKRQPTEDDKIRLMSVQKALRLPDDDPLWTILVALDYYQKLYEEAPARILEATHTASQTTISAAEALTTEKLIDGALRIAHQRIEQARSWQTPLIIVCGLLSAALIVLGISFWFAIKQFQSHEAKMLVAHEKNLAATKDQFNKKLATRIYEIENANAQQLIKDKNLLEWIKQYQDLYKNKDFQLRVDFVAHNPVFIDAVKALTIVQQDNLIRIVNKADRWRELRAASKLPWPCIAITKFDRNNSICHVGLEGEILPLSVKTPN